MSTSAQPACAKCTGPDDRRSSPSVRPSRSENVRESLRPIARRVVDEVARHLSPNVSAGHRKTGVHALGAHQDVAIAADVQRALLPGHGESRQKSF